MKRVHQACVFFSIIILTISVLGSSSFSVSPVHAQEEKPPASSEGENQTSLVGLISGFGAGDEIISSGTLHTCGVKQDGKVACWGTDIYEQASPPSGIFIQVSSNELHTCGVLWNGTVTCWGADTDGQADPPSGVFKQVSSGGLHTCGVRGNGSLACWGDRLFGQSTPPTGIFKQVSSGDFHSCGIRNNGSLACWGDDANNKITVPAGTYIQVDAGFEHSCAVKSDGTVKCWGLKEDGQSTPPSGTFKQVSTGGSHSCGVKSDNKVACWGDNSGGQSTAPAGTFLQVSAGAGHTCGLKTDKKIVCWGDNIYGQSTPPANLFGPIPAIPVTYRPNGDTYTTLPTYSWARIGNAYSYTLKVYDPSTTTYVISKAISNTYCSSSTNRCSYTPTTSLANLKTYRWKILATNGFGRSAYSTESTFKILPGFNSSFNNSYTGWVKHPGGAWFINSTNFYSNGLTAKYSSVSYNKTFSNFTYEARVKQPGTNSGSFHGLILRGYPTLNADNSWKTGLFFVINKDGKFKVYKTISGVTTILKDWTASAYIVKNSWNTLKTTADGSKYKFYINGKLIWSGSDASRVSGRVGFISYSKSTAEKFYADWAKLAMSDYYNKTIMADSAPSDELSLSQPASSQDWSSDSRPSE